MAKQESTAKKKTTVPFSAGDHVVYPAHGVGKIEGIENVKISGIDVDLCTISFTKDRMRLKLPVQKIMNSGLRQLSSKDQIKKAFKTMEGKSHIKRTMWSRRAQEYEGKINSGDPVLIAEVLRDLRRNALGEDQSYSERQIYELALERLASELAAVKNIAEDKASKEIVKFLVEHAAPKKKKKDE